MRFAEHVHYHSLVSLSTRSAVIAADCIVLIVTWAKTLGTYRESRRLHRGSSLAGLILRDGEQVFQGDAHTLSCQLFAQVLYILCERSHTDTTKKLTLTQFRMLLVCHVCQIVDDILVRHLSSYPDLSHSHSNLAFHQL